MARKKSPTIAVQRTPEQKKAAAEMLDVLTSSTATAAALAEVCQAFVTDAAQRFSMVASASLIWRDREGSEALGAVCSELADALKARGDELMRLLERIVPLTQGDDTTIAPTDAVERMRPLMQLHVSMQEDVDD